MMGLILAVTAALVSQGPAAEQKTLLKFKGGVHYSQWAISSDGSRLAAFDGEKSLIYVWDARSGKGVKTLNARDYIQSPLLYRSVDQLAFSPDGKSLAFQGVGQVFVLDTTTFQTKLSLKGDEFAFSGDSKRFAVTARDPDRIQIYAIEKLIKEIVFKENTSLQRIAFNNNGSLVVGEFHQLNGIHRDDLIAFDTATGKEKWSSPDGEFLPQMGFTPDGKKFYCGGSINQGRVFDATNGKSLQQLPIWGEVGEVAKTYLNCIAIDGKGQIITAHTIREGGDVGRFFQSEIQIWGDGKEPLRKIILDKEPINMIIIPGGYLAILRDGTDVQLVEIK